MGVIKMSLDKADINLALHKMSEDPRRRRILPEAHQLEAYIDALKKIRPDILQWKKYTWIGERLKQGKFNADDAEKIRSEGHLGDWGMRNFNDPQDEAELDSMYDAVHDALDGLEFVAAEEDEEKKYNLRRGLRGCFTCFAIAQIERELGKKIES